MDPHHLQHLQQQQQQLLQAQLQQQHHFQPPPPPQYHHFNPNSHRPYYQYPQQHQQQQQQHNGYPQSVVTNLHPHLPPQLTLPPPAAVAFLSQLVDYSAPVGSQWTTAPPMGNFGYNGAQPSFIGGLHGQGRGGSWPLSKHGVPSTSSHPPHQTYQSPVTLTPSPLKTEAPNYQKPQLAPKTKAAWCEVCNSSCINLDVLKQHQSGRRHQRNLRKMERLKNGIRTGAKLQGHQHCISTTKLKVPHQTQCEQGGGEINSTKNLPSEPVGYENSRETGKQNKNLGRPEIPLGDGSENVKRGKKRKKMKTPKQPVEPSKRTVVTRIVCDLCNVKCETQEVFERHLSGKKHFAKYKRYSGHEPMHRRVGLQVLYPPKLGAETIFQSQEGSYVPPHVYQDIPVETSSDSIVEQNPTFEGFESTLRCGSPSIATTAPESKGTIGQHLNGITETGLGSDTSPQNSIL